MALVADYDSGSETDDEAMEDKEPIKTGSSIVLNKITQKELKIAATDEISDEEIEDNFKSYKHKELIKIQMEKSSSNSVSNVLADLPESKPFYRSEITVESDKLEDFIPTVKSIKEGQKEKKVKITIPSLSQFNDLNDQPEAKRIKPSSRGSGLLGLLPPAKSAILSNTTFVPSALKSKNIPQNNKATASNAMIPHSLKRKIEGQKISKTKILLQKHDSDSDASDSDEFSKIPQDDDDQLWKSICARPSKPKNIIVDEPMKEDQIINVAPEPPKAMNVLDNKAFKELIGKAKRPIGNINIIDINEEEILPDKVVWMTKALTDPEVAPRPASADDPVDPTRRRKHHITYLAQQAKANELELKNAWAAGRNNRMMSRSKYGF